MTKIPLFLLASALAAPQISAAGSSEAWDAYKATLEPFEGACGCAAPHQPDRSGDQVPVAPSGSRDSYFSAQYRRDVAAFDAAKLAIHKATVDVLTSSRCNCDGVVPAFDAMIKAAEGAWELRKKNDLSLMDKDVSWVPAAKAPSNNLPTVYWDVRYDKVCQRPENPRKTMKPVVPADSDPKAQKILKSLILDTAAYNAARQDQHAAFLQMMGLLKGWGCRESLEGYNGLDEAQENAYRHRKEGALSRIAARSMKWE